MDGGAEDIRHEGQRIEVICDPDAFSTVAEKLAAAGLEPDSKEVTRLPNTMVDLDVETARKVLKLMDALDDHDDVQNVSANFNIPDEAMAELADS